MSSKTLTDELRSVLLFHSLEAPQPNATVDRILNDTVGSVVALGIANTSDGTAPSTAAPAAVDGSARAPRRMPVHQLVAASVVAVLLLAVAGINSVRNRDAARTASTAIRDQAGQPSPGYAAHNSRAASEASPGATRGGAAAASGAAGSAAGGTALSGIAPQGTAIAAGPARPPASSTTAGECATLPGGHLVTGQRDNYTLHTGETGYLYEFLCVGPNGQRSASEVQVFRQVGGTLRYKQTLLPAAAGEHVDFLTAGSDTVRIQASVGSASSGHVPGEVISTAWDLSEAHPGQGFSFTVASPCLRKDLTATVTPKPDAIAAWLLTLRNHTGTACALEGFPQVHAQRGGTTLATAVPTLNGPAGGLTVVVPTAGGPAGDLTQSPVPPIIVLSPQATAAAIIEQAPIPSGRPCIQSDRLAVSLPHGVSLGELPAELSVCGLEVHPLVGNARGSN
jgi:hypothetical protein